MDNAHNYIEELERKLSELSDVQSFLNNENVKKHFLQPFEYEKDVLKNSYDCDTLKELYFIKGKKKGLFFIDEIIESIENEIGQLRKDIDELRNS